MIIKIIVFCDVTPRSPVGVYRRFGEVCYLNIQASKMATTQHIPEDSNHLSTLIYP